MQTLIKQEQFKEVISFTIFNGHPKLQRCPFYQNFPNIETT